MTIELSEADEPERKPAKQPKGANGPNREAYFPTVFPDIPDMSPNDWWILALLLRGHSLPQIAVDTDIPHPKLMKIVSRAVFQEQLQIQTRTMIEKITNGEYGVSAIAKANAPDAMRRIVKLSSEADPRTRLQASKEVLNYAGYQPPKRIEISLDGMVDKMDTEEKLHFAQTGEWPDRLIPQVERLVRKQEDDKVANAKRITDQTSK